eukprot:140341_1
MAQFTGETAGCKYQTRCFWTLVFTAAALGAVLSIVLDNDNLLIMSYVCGGLAFLSSALIGKNYIIFDETQQKIYLRRSFCCYLCCPKQRELGSFNDFTHAHMKVESMGQSKSTRSIELVFKKQSYVTNTGSCSEECCGTQHLDDKNIANINRYMNDWKQKNNINQPTTQLVVQQQIQQQIQQPELPGYSAVAVNYDNMNERNLNRKQLELKQWLEHEVELPQYFSLLIQNGVDDLSIMKIMTQESLGKIGINIGHTMKIMHCVKKLNQENVEGHQQQNMHMTYQ